jgi:dolichol-phosphate mannosyltransferase
VQLSLVIPAHNEADGLRETVVALEETLCAAGVPHEILVVNDHSSDNTVGVLARLEREFPSVRWVDNERPGGFGYAVRTGLEQFRGDAVCIVMADASDDPQDVVRHYRLLEDGYDCVFGSRFMSQSRVVDYPRHKLLINRLANTFIRLLFGLPYNDVTNAFKCYRRDVIDGIQPILACHFNLTVEMPLKAITRGYTYGVVPINWYNRTTGISKLKIKEMGSRYLFIVLYVLLEKLLSRGDYRRPDSRRTVVAREQPMQRSGDD